METSTHGKDKTFDSNGYFYTLKRKTNRSTTWRCSYHSSKINFQATVCETEWIPGREHKRKLSPGGSIAASIIITAKTSCLIPISVTTLEWTKPDTSSLPQILSTVTTRERQDVEPNNKKQSPGKSQIGLTSYGEELEVFSFFLDAKRIDSVFPRLSDNLFLTNQPLTFPILRENIFNNLKVFVSNKESRISGI
ncbi:hypothetical protein LSH36_6g05042 [Paralvinella palmiformis]|uniref:FLYWCH-type domain-containing protein n=1 Tax=Paralvinella palmiformis TaxID=53620 RepID=A0AAD9KEN6_9ANNE|nr:hypothetical protein LSH36_6g05042 [Paralvinella palmiformis]